MSEAIEQSIPILVIDDSATARAELRMLLESHGHRVLEAQDGQQALQILEQNPAVRLAICDIHMPIMDGIEFLKNAKQSNAYPDLTVVMLTTAGKPKLVRAARDAGAKGYVVKPFKPELMMTLVQKTLN